MDLLPYLHAILLGLIEGATEFLPVSSTGHLILAGHLMGFEGPPGRVFEIAIQLGAILAVSWAYRARLLGVAARLTHDAGARRFTFNIVVAVLPALAAGALLHSTIKTHLMTPWVVCSALVLGGIAILLIERLRHRAEVEEVERMPVPTAFKIGLFQLLAMIPGVSRSAATIMGGLLVGASRRAATEFSFFLAIPTMLAATVYDLYKSYDLLSLDDGAVIATGFVVAFLAALAVVRTLVAFVSRYGFAPFAWYRIGLGLVMGALLLS